MTGGEGIDARWTPFEWFLLRGTGFPFSWLLPEANVRENSPRARRASKATLEEARERLWKLAVLPRFREALLLSNPDFESKLDHYRDKSLADGKRRSMTRQRERTVLRYAQRFAAKNDTTSIFGAAAAGRFGLECSIDGALPIHATRTVLPTQWVIEELLMNARRELAGIGAFTEFPRRGQGLSLDQDGVTQTTLSLVSGEPALHQRRFGSLEKLAVELSDGATPLSSLAGELARRGDLSRCEGEALLWSLIDDGPLLSVCHLPTGLDDPLGFARSLLLRQPESDGRTRWLERLDALVQCAGVFAALELAERRQSLHQMEGMVARWTGATPRRGPGQYNISRLIIHETADRVGEAIGLPDEWERSLGDELAPYLELSFAVASLERSRFRDWFAQRLGASADSVLWTDVWREIRRDPNINRSETTRTLERALETLQQRLRGLVDEHLERRGAATPLSLDESLVQEVLDDVSDELDAGTGYANPDVAIAGSRAAPMLVLAEAHHVPMHSGQLLTGLACADAINDATRSRLEALCGGRYALPVHEQLAFNSVTFDVGQIALEISGSSPLPPERKVSFYELRANLSNGAFRFTAPTYSGQVVELAPLTRFAHLGLASHLFPVTAFELCEWLCEGGWRELSELPRIALGQLVVHRRLWQIPSEVLTSAPNLEKAFDALAEHCGEGLPRFVFLWAMGEPKPIFLDLVNPLFREMMLWLARRNAMLEIVEMLPGPQDLWLESEEGLHTSELRMVFFREGGSRPR